MSDLPSMTSYTVQFKSGTSCTVLDATSGAAALAIARYETGDKTTLVLTYRIRWQARVPLSLSGQ